MGELSMIIISSNNVGNRVDGASGFEIKHLKPLNPLTLMVKLFQHYPMIHMGYGNKSTCRRKLVENCTKAKHNIF